MIVRIFRTKQNENGTLGELFIEGMRYCFTLELPWNDNKSDISCIPEGTYTCKLINSPHFGVVFKILDVPGRTDVLIHTGNFLKSTRGCVLLGTALGNTKPYSILNSKIAFEGFMARMADYKVFTLEIYKQN